uniref:EF-hand domain-containing protein n=2 Tax=Panagrolaimus sp. PS1159 TaxID=55785 RepID=A0AC35EVQ8_9BILA
MAAWDMQLHEMFNATDKDGSGTIGKEDIMLMLLAADKEEKQDPIFKTNLKFLINVINSNNTLKKQTKKQPKLKKEVEF